MNILPVTSYPYTSLSANYPHDNYISFNPYFQQYDNGHYLFKHDVFSSINDLSFNRYNGFYVTDKFVNSDIIKSRNLSRVESFTNSFLNLFLPSILNFVSVGDDGYLYANEVELENAAEFQVIIDDSDDTIHFVYNKAYYVVTEEDSPWRLKLYYNDGEVPPTADSYKFKYYKYNNNYLVYTSYGSQVNGVTTRYLKAAKNGSFLGFFGTTLQDEGIQIGFNFLNYDYVPQLLLAGLSERSWFYSYYNKPIDFEKNINAYPNMTKSVSGVRQNFLLSVPYETKISDAIKPDDLNGLVNVSTLNLDILSLKNVKNPNYKYSRLPYNLEGDYNFDEVDDRNPEGEVNKRNYSRIFTGSNQEYGYEMPLLVYSVNNKSLELLKDNTTYFHYPSTAPIINIKDSGLQECGAFPSLIPFYADKVFKKDAGYGEHIHWGNSSQFNNGQWLCSWLSGSNEESIWMDRWYNPDDLTVFEALTATMPEVVACGVAHLTSEDLSFFDVPSILTFEPEVWYKYFHVGEDFIKYSVDEVVNYNDAYLKLHYDNWSVSAIKDETGINKDGGFINFDGANANTINGIADKSARLNGVNEYVYIPYSDSIKPVSSTSFSIWAKSDDWTSVRSSDIVSNGIGNYYSLKVTNGLENPISVLYAQDTNKLILLNSDNKAYSFVNLSDGLKVPSVSNICVDNNLNIWALDDANNYLYKASYGGVIDLKITFGATDNLSNLTLDSSGNVYVLEATSGMVSSFDINGQNIQVSATTLSGGGYRMECDLNDNLVGYECYKMSIDNNNYPWILSTDKKTLYRFSSPVLSVQDHIEDFIIDSQSNVWVVADYNKLYKLDSVGNLATSAIFPVVDESLDDGRITVQNDYYVKTDGDEDFIVIYKGNYLYEFDSALHYLKKYNTAVIPDESNYVGSLTDWSGYSFGRKYVYLKNFNGVKNLQLTVNLFESTGDISECNIFISMARLYKGWHHFVGVFDQDTSTVKLYIDGELEGRVKSVASGSEIYKTLKNPMLLGNKMGVINGFNDEIGVKGKYLFKGGLDDFRIYNKALSQLEVQLLHKLKQAFVDIDWHIPTGVHYYVEEVQRFFKHKLSGAKSNHYNIKIMGLQIDDEAVRSQIERIIKDTVRKVSPAYTQLHKIMWDVEN